ncbi:MAG: hypothetical protein F6J95_001140 [Leptolyngbya sp. SIO1E4]|nr:hypothetical protein [Leptolyngbya sp. SIO1E4]
MAFEDACRTLAKTLRYHSNLFAEAISGIEAMPARLWYGQVLLNRLLLLYDLQVAGFLGQGDRWYLHNHLGHCQQQQPNRFYRHYLQPLCHQGVGLPEIERPLPVQTTFGQVPYLGSRLFQPHSLEQQYPEIDLPDEPFELLLGWLAEQPWHRTFEVATEPNAITRITLAGAWEYWHTGRTGKAIVSAPETLQDICDHTLDAYVLRALHQHQGHPGPPVASVDALIAELDAPTCYLLLETILPRMTILDPACGSGRFLLMALARMGQLYQACWTQAQQSPDLKGQSWGRSPQAAKPTTAWALAARILTQNLYGVDLRPEAVEVTQLQLWLALLSTTSSLDDLAPLPDLDFNLTTGNALVGFIRVDEQSFDQIAPKRQCQAAETVLQGNLLQPLTAASYRDTLAEKQIRIEHYRAQTKAMAEAGGIPEYVQTEFLRDRIDEVNQAAQQKLNRLLLETCSQTLGIQVREPQPTGRTHKRLLIPADIAALHPFHWGFFFNRILEQQGGFDIIVTHPPTGTLRASADEFYSQYAHRFQPYQIDRAAFRRSRRLTLQQIPALAKLWATYAGRFSYLRAYFRRSEAYQLPSTPAATRSIPLKTLFAQRCAALLSPEGMPPYLYLP